MIPWVSVPGARLPQSDDAPLGATRGRIQGVELYVAVCEAGGFGSLPTAMLAPAELRDEIAEVRTRTRAPFNVYCTSARQYLVALLLLLIPSRSGCAARALRPPRFDR